MRPSSSRKNKATHSLQLDVLPNLTTQSSTVALDSAGQQKKFIRIMAEEDNNENPQSSSKGYSQFPNKPNNLLNMLSSSNSNAGTSSSSSNSSNYLKTLGNHISTSSYANLNHSISNHSFLTSIIDNSSFAAGISPQTHNDLKFQSTSASTFGTVASTVSAAVGNRLQSGKDSAQTTTKASNTLRLILSSDSPLGKTSKEIFFPKQQQQQQQLTKEKHNRMSTSHTLSNFGFISPQLKPNPLSDLIRPTKTSSGSSHPRFFARNFTQQPHFESPILAKSPENIKQRKEQFFSDLIEQDNQKDNQFKLKLNLITTPPSSKRNNTTSKPKLQNYKSGNKTSDNRTMTASSGSAKSSSRIDFKKTMSMTQQEAWFPGKKGIDLQFRLLHKKIDILEDKQKFLQKFTANPEATTPTNNSQNGSNNASSTFLLDFVSTMNRIAIPPKKMNFLKENSNCTVLDISNSHITSMQSAEFFSEIIRKDPYKSQLLTLIASQNKITDEILNQYFLKYLPIKLESLTLKHNLISNAGITAISEKLSSNNSSLIILDLENNKIRDIGAQKLFKALVQNFSLTKLNLSQNMIGDMCAADLRDLLESSMQLQELYLKWNNFRTEGGLLIAQGLRKNQSLKVFDLSFNNIGSSISAPSQPPSTLSAAKRLALEQSLLNASIGHQFEEVLLQNKRLIHLDLSSCCLTPADLKYIQSGLQKNHTLFGFHIDGNLPAPGRGVYCMDTNGFIVIRETQSFSDSPSAFTHSIQGVQHTVKQQQQQQLNLRSHDHCWLCEGWELLEFFYDDSQNSKRKVISPIFIHFDFDDYRGHKMQNVGESRYSLRKMCPPNGTLKYFITEPEQQQILLDEASNQIVLPKPTTIQVIYPLSKPQQQDVKTQIAQDISNQESNEEVIELEVTYFNTIDTFQQNIFSADYYQIVDASIRDS